ncbi:MAG: hypothetical protein ABJN26_00605 [Stappiaceae bacterium]
MKPRVAMALVCCVPMLLPAAGVSQTINANEGDTITVEAGGKRDQVKVPFRSIFISDVSIDYKPWQTANAHLNLDRQDAAKAYEREREAYNKATANIRKALKAYQQASRVMNEKRLTFRRAEEVARTAEIDEERKSPEFKRTEERIEAINQRLETIDERVAYLQQNRGAGSAEATLALISENDRLELEQADLLKRLQQMKLDPAIQADLANAQALASRLDAEYLELRKAAKRAENDLAIAEGQHELASTNYARASDTYETVSDEFDRLSATGLPLITGIASLDFRASFWSPEKELEAVQATIAELGKQLQLVEIKRKRYRQEFNDAVEETIWAAEDLNDAIYQSAVSQWLVESGFFLYDVGKAASRGGPYAAGAEVIKKSIEIAVFPPSYYDATLTIGDAALATWSGLPEKVGKRGLKSGTTGHATKTLIARYLKQKGEQNLDELWGTFMRDSWFDEAMRSNDPEFYSQMTEEIGKIIADQRTQLQESEEAFAKLMGREGFSELAKKVGGSFIKGLVKDLSKEVLKKAAAEFFEGRAFQSYMRLQAYTSATARQLQRASSMYWTARDLYDLQLALRDQMIAQFDPDAQLKVERNERFIPADQYEFRLNDNNANAFEASERDVSVTLGNVELERFDKSLVFVLPAGAIDRLKRDVDGGVKLQIVILR